MHRIISSSRFLLGHKKLLVVLEFDFGVAITFGGAIPFHKKSLGHFETR